MTALTIVDLLVRGAGISSCLFFCLILLSQGMREQTVWRGILYALCVAAFLVWSANWFDQLHTALAAPILALTLLNPLLFWLASRAMFEDSQRFDATERVVSIGGLALVFTVVALRINQTHALEPIITTAYRLSAFVLVITCMGQMIRNYGDDLLGPRRRLRVFLFGILGTYFVVLFASRFLFPEGKVPDWLPTANALLVTALIMANNYVCTRFREELLPLSTSSAVGLPEAVLVSHVEPELASRAVEAMERDLLHRDPKLSIAALSEHLGTQEYLLRRSINQALGYRNFSQFVNSFRLEEAKAALSDPARYHQSILTLAYESGFNSIGPFNRAFKDAFGQTPSEFRRSQRKRD